MPIKGLTDRQAAFPEIGRIRKGAPKTEEGYVGKDLTYFRIELDMEEKEAAKILNKSYPEKPAELNILLPFNSVDENFDAWREKYVAGGLVHRCDGERVWYEINPQTGERIVTQGEPLKSCDGKIECKPAGRLKVLIPELQRLAYMTVITGSVHDILNISRQLEALLQINGRLAGVPMKLRRRPVEISTPSGKDGKRARRTKWLISIEADPIWVQHKLQSMKLEALPEMHGALPLLEAPEESDVDWTMEEELKEEPHLTDEEIDLDPTHRIENQWEQEVVDKIDELQLFQARPHIVNVLNRSPFFKSVPYGELDVVAAVAYAIRWVQIKNENPTMDIDERNKIVDDTWEEYLPMAYENLGLEMPEA